MFAKYLSFWSCFLLIMFFPCCFAQDYVSTFLTKVSSASSSPKPSSEYIKKGKDLFFKGKTTGPDGQKGKLISEVFTCNHCHNSSQEDPDLAVNDPQARLHYVSKNNMPLLQGTTMYGTYNRESWFNDDYIKKYGADLIGPAQKNLSEAIKLCSKECSVGRDLESWELRSLEAYIWSLQYKMSDLRFTPLEEKVIQNYTSYPPEEVISLVKSKYLPYSSATFVEGPSSTDGYGGVGDPLNGKKVFESSCLHCHGQDTSVKKVRKFKDTRGMFKYLSRFKHSYHVIRKGAEKKFNYMPLYTQERMSNKQADDLYSYILKRSKEEE